VVFEVQIAIAGARRELAQKRLSPRLGYFGEWLHGIEGSEIERVDHAASRDEKGMYFARKFEAVAAAASSSSK
jgi:hypothetical protein